MIPAILAAPMVQSILGSVVGSVAGSVGSIFAGHPSATAPSSGASTASFGPILNQIAARASASLYAEPTGAMTSLDWNGMSSTDLHSWMMNLTGRHVNATDIQGHTTTGIVQGFSTMGGGIGLNVSGHFIPLSQLHQVTWSPAVH